MVCVKYSTWGGVEWEIQHDVKLSAVFAIRPTLSAEFFCTSRVNGTSIDIWEDHQVIMKLRTLKAMLIAFIDVDLHN